MSNSLADEEAALETFLSTHEAHIDVLYTQRDIEGPPLPTGFSLEESQKLKEFFDGTRERLELSLSAPSASSRAQVHYLLGKLLNVIEGFDEQAKYHLKQAVKLKPPPRHLVKALVCLSFCDSKKNHLAAAKKTLDQAWKLDPNNMDLLIELSTVKARMVLSLLNRDVFQFENESKERLCEDVIKHATQAIPLDVVLWDDPKARSLDPMARFKAKGLGKAYYCAGVGYLLSWFVTGCLHGEKLSQSIEAFKNVGKMKISAKYLYISGMAAKYFGDFKSATTAFRFLADVCPSIDVATEFQSIMNVCKEVGVVISPYGGTTSENSLGRKTKVSSDFSLNILKLGPNKRRTVLCNAIRTVKAENGTILCLASDKNETQFLLLVYGVPPTAISPGNRLNLQDPYLHVIDYLGNQDLYHIKLVFLHSRDHLRVNGTPVVKIDVNVSPPILV